MSGPRGVEEIRGALGVKPPPQPHWMTKASPEDLLQNGCITAQVCIKAAAKMAAGAIAGGMPAHEAENMAKRVAKMFMADALDFIRSDFKAQRKRARGTKPPQKEPAK